MYDNLKKPLYLAIMFFISIGLFTAGCTKTEDSKSNANPPEELILATTTSTYDSGLLDILIPNFEKENNAAVKVIAVGTGQALELGRRGDADVILVHARNLEDRFIEEGYGVDREDVMYNDFIVVGPKNDPAGIKGIKSVGEGFSILLEKGRKDKEVVFVSRGDNSGTHNKEKGLWENLGYVNLSGETWYKSIGQGMGETLTMANEMRAYTLTDRGTYLARKKDLANLEIVIEGDDKLFNPYGIMAVNPKVHPHVNYTLAKKFIDYMISYEVQQKISEFGTDKYGQPLFFPDSKEWKKKNQNRQNGN